jgi:hypothetical protein
LCDKFYCNYLQDCAQNDTNHLAQVSDFDFAEVPDSVLRGNTFERKVVMDCLERNRRSIPKLFKDLIKDALHELDFAHVKKRLSKDEKKEEMKDEEGGDAVALTRVDVVCKACSGEMFSELLYAYAR